jgi:hypothetical protein
MKDSLEKVKRITANKDPCIKNAFLNSLDWVVCRSSRVTSAERACLVTTTG